jgi:CRP-like cAMP-binding protein
VTWRGMCATCPAKAYSICRPREEDRQQELFAYAMPMFWARRQPLFRSGVLVSVVHTITSGMVAISKPIPNGQRQIVDFLMAGDICGFLQSGTRYAYDGDAITDTTTCTINFAALQGFVARHRDVAMALEEVMIQRQERLAEHIAAIGQMKSTARVAYFLTWLGKAYASRLACQSAPVAHDENGHCRLHGAPYRDRLPDADDIEAGPVPRRGNHRTRRRRTSDGQKNSYRIAGQSSHRHVLHRSRHNRRVTVGHKGKWFRIDDTDFQSKWLFASAMPLFSISDVGMPNAPPVVTVPAN